MPVETYEQALGLTAVVTAVVTAAMGYVGLYGRYWWYDNLAHLLGGAAVGALAALGYETLLAGGPVQVRAVVVATVAAALAGTAWELLEYGVGVRPWTGRWPLDRSAEDTLLDMAFVLVGAALAVVGSEVVV